ncbi:hypothetical protein MEO41_25975, partial [Dolichospermum sp. ST_sed4]|nr:hypothetical protein [Dolichospermum sp. ST_sed4]
KAAYTGQFLYQAKLTNSVGVPVSNGVKSITFKLYDDPISVAPGNLKWTETDNVTTKNGVFSVLLTPPSSIYANDLWLEVSYSGETFYPRRQLSTIPFTYSTGGFNWGSPGAIGTVTPNSGNFSLFEVVDSAPALNIINPGVDNSFQIARVGTNNVLTFINKILFGGSTKADSNIIKSQNSADSSEKGELYLSEVGSGTQLMGKNIYFNIQNANRLKIDSSGLIGIGTGSDTLVSSLLTIKGSNQIKLIDSDGDTYSSKFNLSTSGLSVINQVLFGGSPSDVDVISNSSSTTIGDVASSVYYQGKDKISYGTMNGETMRLNSGGLMIFGTGSITDPTSPLQLGGGIDASGSYATAMKISPTITASANGDVLTALKIDPNFIDGSYTGVNHYGFVSSGGNLGIGIENSDSTLAILSSTISELKAIDISNYFKINKVSAYNVFSIYNNILYNGSQSDSQVISSYNSVNDTFGSGFGTTQIGDPLGILIYQGKNISFGKTFFEQTITSYSTPGSCGTGNTQVNYSSDINEGYLERYQILWDINQSSKSAILSVSVDGTGGYICVNGTSMVLSNGDTIRNSRNNDWIKLTSTGLGIGTSTPYYAIDIVGNVRLQSSGKLLFGGTGALDADVNFYRPVMGLLKTDDTFQADGGFISSNNGIGITNSSNVLGLNVKNGIIIGP